MVINADQVRIELSQSPLQKNSESRPFSLNQLNTRQTTVINADQLRVKLSQSQLPKNSQSGRFLLKQ